MNFRKFGVAAAAAAVLAAGLLGPMQASAQTREQVLPNRTIGQVKVYDTFLSIRVSPAIANSNGCTASTATSQLVLDWSSNADLKNMYAVILMAKALDSDVGFGLQGCNNSGFPLIYRVDLGRP